MLMHIITLYYGVKMDTKNVKMYMYLFLYLVYVCIHV